MFRAINECQALHPDPEDDETSGDEDDDDDDGVVNEDNDFRDDDDEQEQEMGSDEAVDRIDMLEGEFDPDSVQLSARGRQIWERLNAAANARHQCK